MPEVEVCAWSRSGPDGAPLRASTDEGVRAPVRAFADAGPGAAPGSRAAVRRTILVVEDDRDARFVLAAILEHHGYGVLQARNGREGVELAREHAPDLVVMDIHMPVMDGFAAGEALRSDGRTQGIPVVAVTADRFGAEGQRRIRSLFHSCLWKPIEPLRLLDHVRGILGS